MHIKKKGNIYIEVAAFEFAKEALKGLTTEKWMPIDYAAKLLTSSQGLTNSDINQAYMWEVIIKLAADKGLPLIGRHGTSGKLEDVPTKILRTAKVVPQNSKQSQMLGLFIGQERCYYDLHVYAKNLIPIICEHIKAKQPAKVGGPNNCMEEIVEEVLGKPAIPIAHSGPKNIRHRKIYAEAHRLSLSYLEKKQLNDAKNASKIAENIRKNFEMITVRTIQNILGKDRSQWDSTLTKR